MNSKKYYIILFLGVFALSTSAVLVKIAQAPSAIVAFYRLFFSVLCLLPFYRRETKSCSFSKQQWRRMAWCGLLLSLHYILWFESLHYTSVSSSTFLVCLQPVFSFFYGRVLLQESMTRKKLAGCAIALVGMAVIAWGDIQLNAQALLGDSLALIAAAVISLYFLEGQKLRQRLTTLQYTLPTYGFSVVFLAIYALLQRDEFTGYSTMSWLCFLGLALIPTIGGQFVFHWLLKHLPATSITMAILGEPVGTYFFAYFLLQERMGWRQLLGSGWILLGMAVFFWQKKGQEKNKSLHSSMNTKIDVARKRN